MSDQTDADAVAGQSCTAAGLGCASPILRIFDEEKAMAFYLGFLGFKLDWEHRFGAGLPLYAQVSRSGLRLHLSGHHGDASPGSTTVVPTERIEALHRELTGRDYPYCRPSVEQLPWGLVMTVTDPFGNRLRFHEARAADPA